MTHVGGRAVTFCFSRLKTYCQVLHRQLIRFHASLKLAGSLDETISLHESQLVKFKAIHQN